MARLKEAMGEMTAFGLHSKLEQDRAPSYVTVKRWVNGENEAPPSFFDAVAPILGVRLAWLLTGEQPKTEEAAQRASDEQLRQQLAQLDAERLGELDLGVGAYRERRIDALLRFARKLHDADRLTLRSAWGSWGEPMRSELLLAAGTFLLAADAAIDAAYHRCTGAIVHRVVLSSSDYVDWSDAVLDLFARRIVGLGARRHEVIDLETAMAMRELALPREITPEEVARRKQPAAEMEAHIAAEGSHRRPKPTSKRRRPGARRRS